MLSVDGLSFCCGFVNWSLIVLLCFCLLGVGFYGTLFSLVVLLFCCLVCCMVVCAGWFCLCLVLIGG